MDDIKNVYVIDAKKWGVYTDGTHSLETSTGINNALQYASQNKYPGAYLSNGTYLIDAVSQPIVLPDKLSFYMHPDCVLQAETTFRPLYSILNLVNCSNLEIKGGQIIGDTAKHIFYLTSLFESGGINDATGATASDSTKIRTINFLDSSMYHNFFDEDFFLIQKNGSISPTTCDVYQYNANGVFISKITGVTLQTNVYSSNPQLKNANAVKFKIVITQADPAGAQVYMRNGIYPTHEFGYGIQLLQCTNIKIADCYIGKCTGDSIIFDHSPTYASPNTEIIVDHCILDGNRRQGISVVSGQYITIKNNAIKNIAGTDPQYGIDIEDETGHGNDILIENNIFTGNNKGDINNFNGKNVIIRKNIMQGGVGGVNTYAIANVYGYNSVYEDNIITGLGTGVGIDCHFGAADYSSKWFIARGNIIKGFMRGIVVSKANLAIVENNHIENCVDGITFDNTNYLFVKGNTHYNNTNTNYDWLGTVVNGSIVGETIYNSTVVLPKNVPIVASSFLSCLLSGCGGGSGDAMFVNCIFNAMAVDQTKQLVAYDGNFKFKECVFKGTISDVAGKNAYYIIAGNRVTFEGCTIETNACQFLAVYNDALLKDCNIKMNATTPITMFKSVAFDPALFIIQNCNFRNTGAGSVTIDMGTAVSASYFINNVMHGAITLVKKSTHSDVNTVTIA